MIFSFVYKVSILFANNHVIFLIFLDPLIIFILFDSYCFIRHL